jgi:probable blue pigment (indigoidine) exporter
MFLIFLQNAAMAAGFPVSKFLVRYITPFQQAGIRLLATGIVMSLFAYRIRSTWLPLLKGMSRTAKQQLFGVGFFFFYLSMGCGAWALMKIPTGYASLAYNTTPFIVALLSFIYFGERLRLVQWLGMVIGFSGMALGMQFGSGVVLDSVALMMLVIAVVSYALGFVLMKMLVAAGIPGEFVNACAMLNGGILAIGTSYFFEPVQGEHGMHTIIPMAIVVCSSLTSGLLNGYLMKIYPATLLAFASFLIPLCATTYSWLFLGETIHPQFFAMLGFVLVGLYLFLMPGRKVEESKQQIEAQLNEQE